MAYERNDRWSGGDRDRNDRYGSGDSYGSRDRSGGYDRDQGGRYGRPGYGADRGNSYYGSANRSGYGSGNRDDDRGFFERAGDEVRSWFGDEEAERRRRDDDRREGRDAGYESDRGYRGGTSSSGDYGRGAISRDYTSGWDNDRGYRTGSDQRSTSSSYGSSSRSGSDRQGGYDPHYSDWRDRQIQAFDRDYDEYRQHNQSRFESEFGTWRQSRQGQRDQLRQVKEHQNVVGSDGEHLGTVDHVRGDNIKLTKNDQAAGGHHHLIPSSWITTVEGDTVTINKTAAEAKRHWTEADGQNDQNSRSGLFGRDERGEQDRQGQGNLNRSFSGTY